jgi:hypothetical protein
MAVLAAVVLVVAQLERVQVGKVIMVGHLSQEILRHIVLAVAVVLVQLEVLLLAQFAVAEELDQHRLFLEHQLITPEAGAVAAEMVRLVLVVQVVVVKEVQILFLQMLLALQTLVVAVEVVQMVHLLVLLAALE